MEDIHDAALMALEIRRRFPDLTDEEVAKGVESCSAWGHPRGSFVLEDER
jgi:hypothetical protein